MANMSYCRFRNTLNDLRDCESNFDDISSIEELVAAKRLLQACQRIVDSIDMEDLIMQEELYYEETEDEGPEYDSAGFTEKDR
jgi:flagellar biosynthesis regulator FlbT